MSWAAVIAGGGAILGGVLSSQGAKKAANAASSATDAAAAEQAREFDLVRGDTAGRINIGNQAVNALGAIYGYSPNVGPASGGSNAFAGAKPAQISPIPTSIPGGALNIGGTLLSGNSLLSKIHDPFASRHGDENRNLSAFAAESGVMQLPNGKLILPDGSTFDQSQLKDVAGTWYGAMHAPDGNQADWQQRYSTLLGGLQKDPSVAAPAGNAGGGLTSDGVPNSAPLQAGNAGTNPMAGPDYSNFFKSPDYTFRRDEGIKGIENTASAMGGVRSGNALKALADFNSNLAAGEFGNYFNRQAAIAGIGQTATNTSTVAGTNAANQTSNAIANGGNARASGIAGQYDAYGNALNGVGQAVGNYFARPKTAKPAYDGSWY